MTYRIVKVSFGRVIKSIFSSSDSLYASGMGTLGTADVIDTGARNVDIYTNGFANGGHPFNPEPNSASMYSQRMYVNGLPAQGLTPGGYGVFAATVIGTGFGLIRSYYQNYHAEHVSSLAYLYKRFQKIDKTHAQAQLILEAEFLSYVLANRQAILDKLDQNGYGYHSNRYTLLERQAAFKLKTVEARSENAVSKFWNDNIANSKATNVFSTVWNWVVGHSFIFWIVWMPVAVFAGPLAMLTVPFMAPVLAITFAIGAVVTAMRISEYFKESSQQEKQLINIKSIVGNGLVTDNDADSLFQQDVQAIIRHLKTNEEYSAASVNKKASIILERYEQEVAAASVEKGLLSRRVKQRLFMKFEHAQNKKLLSEMSISLKRVSESKSADLPAKMDQAQAAMSLKNRLSMSASEYGVLLAGKLIGAIVVGLIVPVFAIWLLSSIGVVIPVVAGIAAAAFNFNILTPIGAVFATVMSFNVFSGMARERAQHNTLIAEKLNKAYKDSDLTKAEKFVELEAQMKTLLDQAKSSGVDVLELKNRGYDLNQIDVNNDYYFEKQKYQPTAWTMVKKGFNRIYEVLGGVGTGTTVPRMLFMAGGVFAASLPLVFGAAAIPFLVIGLTLAVGIAVVRLASYQAKRNQDHHQHFANTIDDRISYMKKRVKELKLIVEPTKGSINGVLDEVQPGRVAQKQVQSASLVRSSLFASPLEGVLPAKRSQQVAVDAEPLLKMR